MPPKVPSQYLKNVEAIATACGVHFGKQRKRKNAALAPVRAWLQRPDFPRRARQGHRREHVLAWHEETILGKKPEVRGQPENVQLPANGKEAGEPELFVSDSEGFERTLDLWEDKLKNPEKWLESPLQSWQLKRLEVHRPQLFVKPGDPPPAPTSDLRPPTSAPGPGRPAHKDLCDTYTELAARLALHYTNPDGSSQLKYELDKQSVSDWKQGKRLDGKPGPPARIGAKRQMSVREWITWFDAHFWSEWKLDAAADIPGLGALSLPRLREQDEREQIEFHKFQRQVELGKYIEVGSAGKLAAGALRQLGDYWRTRNEGALVAASREKLLALGVGGEIAGLHTDWLRVEHERFTDDVETKCAAQAEKYRDEVKAEVDRAMKLG